MSSVLRWCLASLAALVIAGPLPAGAGPADFLGRWRIVEAFDDAASPLASPLAGTEVVFAEGHVDAPAPLGCGAARYTQVAVPPPGLFQGWFAGEVEADAFALAHRLAPEAETLRVDCDGGSFDYHRASGDLLVMLDGAILRLTRP